MTSTSAALPTAWLAPPDGLLPGNHRVNITPIPISISSTIAVLVCTIVIVLFNCKKKAMFLEDHIVHASDNRSPTTTNQTPRASQIPATQYPPPTLPATRPAPPALEAGPKFQAVLGLTRTNESRQEDPSPPAHQSYYAPRLAQYRGYDSDDETLNDEERNSAYLPYPHSDVGDDVRKASPDWLDVPRGDGGRSPVSDAGSFRVRSPLSLASRTRLGDAY